MSSAFRAILFFCFFLQVISILASASETEIDQRTWAELGNYLFSEGRTTEDPWGHENATNIEPRLAVAWNNKGVVLSYFGRYDEAIQAYDNATKTNPYYAEAWNNKGNVLNDIGRYDEAIQAYDNATKIYPNLAEAWYNKGNVFTNIGRYDVAIQAYDNATRIDPKYAEAWNNKGNALGYIGRNYEALQAYGNATKINPNHAEAWNNKGIVLNDIGRYDEAIQAYDNATNSEPKFAVAWYNKGNVLNNIGRKNEALQAYNNATNSNPRFAEAWNNKGVVLSYFGQKNEALKAFNNATNSKPSLIIAWYNKGTIFIELEKLNGSKDISIAESCFKTALEKTEIMIALNPRDHLLWTIKGATSNQLGKLNEIDENDFNAKLWFKEGLNALNRSIEINAKYSYSWNEKNEALKGLGRPAEAAMAISVCRGLDAPPSNKYNWFILIILIFLMSAFLGYKHIIKGRNQSAEIVLFMNAMGYLGFLWILTGLLEYRLLAKVLLIGLVVAAFTYFLKELIENASSHWQDQIAIVVSESITKYLPKVMATHRSKLNFLGFLSVLFLISASCSLFFFYIIHQQDDSALQAFRFSLIIVIFFDILAALPLILVMRSRNLSPDTRNIIFICLFGILLLNSLIFMVYQWSIDCIPQGGLSLGDIELSITPTIFAFMVCSFIALVMVPYILGWRRSKKWRIVLLEKRQNILDELLDILEISKSAEYGISLKALIEKIESNIHQFRREYTLFPEDVIDRQGQIKLKEPICGHSLLTTDPRLNHLQALGSLKSKLQINLEHLESIWGGDGPRTQKANELAGVYRIRRDEIMKQIEDEKKTRISLWLDLSPIIYTLITVLFSVILRYMIETSEVKDMAIEMVKMISVAS